MPFHPSPLTISTTVILLLALTTVTANTVTDLEALIRQSTTYITTPSLCAQCAVAGSPSSGCWGQSTASAVYHSACADTSCFCNNATRENTTDYIETHAAVLARECGEADKVTAQMAVALFEDVCNEGGGGGSATDTEASASGSDSASSTTPAATATGGESHEDNAGAGNMGWGAILGAVVGTVSGVAAIVGAFFGWRMWKQNREGSKSKESGPTTAEGQA